MPIDRDLLNAMVEGTASKIGAEFFDTLVKRLAQAAGTKCAWVTEWLEEENKLRALSFWAGDRYVTDYVYDIANTPCEPVFDRCELVHVPDRLIELFPNDPDLAPLSAVSYMGIPLLDTDDRMLGHLALLHDEPLPPDPRVTAVFRIFAGRAAAELGRLRRDRELAERERKLSRIIDSAMDAIIELDERLSVNNVNPAARKIFALDEAAEVSGESFKAFLTRDSFDQLVYFVGELDRKRDGLQSLWLSGGVNARTRDGAVFPAEATLSRFEIDGRPFYTLILRDMNELQKAEERIRYLQSQVDALRGSDEILGESDVLGRVLDDVDRVAEQDTTVLITGETGTGKELIVGAIHRRSSRADKSLIRVNCAAIAANLQESEFFGHEKGAFTGATQRREGRFKLADGGTIFLDEVGEMPLDLQAKLLRVLQEGEFDPVGSTRTETIDVRVIAATNQDLVAMVEEGSFRRDLLYRLNVFPLHLPPLRDRGDDVSILAEAFLRKLIERGGRSRIRLTENCKARLRRYDWPGNVRELENVIERAFITTTDGRLLNLDRALPKTHGTGPDATAAPEADPERILTATELRDLERSNLIRGLEAAGWKISGPDGAAERIGLKPNTLASRMKALGIRRPR